MVGCTCSGINFIGIRVINNCYNTPIAIKERKYYTYSEPGYSIINAPVNEADVEKMKEIVGVLKQFNGLSYFDEMSNMIDRLENNLYKSKHPGRTCIQFEDNSHLKVWSILLPYTRPYYKRTSVD